MPVGIVFNQDVRWLPPSPSANSPLTSRRCQLDNQSKRVCGRVDYMLPPAVRDCQSFIFIVCNAGRIGNTCCASSWHRADSQLQSPDFQMHDHIKCHSLDLFSYSSVVTIITTPLLQVRNIHRSSRQQAIAGVDQIHFLLSMPRKPTHIHQPITPAP